MDPDCAICRSPATLRCDCEAKGLDQAVRQAEQRMMQSVYNDIRTWVRSHAQDYILQYFHYQTERRKAAHSAHLERITAHSYHYYHQPPHPNEVMAAQATLKRGIDDDWQASVQRYPEVLEYFYSLVDLSLPEDTDPAVKDPPLSALSGQRKAGRRGGGPSPTVASGSITPHEQLPPARRTPPPLDATYERRTPGLRRQSRGAFVPPPPPPPAYPPGPQSLYHPGTIPGHPGHPGHLGGGY
ncbi:hypothetical protein GGTG_04119 [Gaeumannomyces tritici R3-111a-1]|uniref:Serine/threonine protein phosphatase n=1 Tax=Gaeumannomyces tritici (strain R3-111a-1) TaxID=644352 RepID=J3NS74_GAET3|nr:hypothetical protein GGTG_04119 [Gaeumannomyces tritici R3-111a-1]EJT79030.1 hypothetical protein GGTG_04119 [Gaeumannomyces tritici R3-111a-1]